MLIFRGAEGPIRKGGGGGCKWPAMPIFKIGRAIPVKSHEWKFGSDWLSLSSYCGNRQKIKDKTSKMAQLWSAREGLAIIEGIWKSGNLPYLVANIYGLHFIKIGGTWFFRGQKPPIRGLTIIVRNWNYGNLSYLVANTYGLNSIKIGGISIFRGGGGQRRPIRGVTFDLRCPFSNLGELFQSKVMSENLVWIGWIGGMWIFRGGAEAPY